MVDAYNAQQAALAAAQAARSTAQTANQMEDVANQADDLARAAVQSNNSPSELPQATFTPEKLQHEFKHASDWGINGNWSKAGGEAYHEAIQNHITGASDIFKSTYRGQNVYVFIDAGTGLGVYTDLSGRYIGGWVFSAEQLKFHFTYGMRIN